MNDIGYTYNMKSCCYYKFKIKVDEWINQRKKSHRMNGWIEDG